MEFIQVKLPCT